MPVRTHPPIAREGWLAIALTLSAALVVQYQAPLWSAPVWAALLVLLFLFRDPRRSVPAAPLGVVSPADGYVVSVEQMRDPYLKRAAVRVSLDMRLSGVYALRSPMEGKLMRNWFVDPGEKGEGISRVRALWLQSDEGDDVVAVLRPSHYSMRSACYYQSGERIGQGMRCGFLLFGSRIDIILPPHSRVLVKPGEQVFSGSSIVAQLVHR